MAWCTDGDVLHLGMHSIDICIIGFIDPFFIILYFTLRRLGFASSGDLLDISRDIVHFSFDSSTIVLKFVSVMDSFLILAK